MNREQVTKVLSEELARLTERIKQNHIRAGQVASGRTLRSITYDVQDNVGVMYGRFPFGTLETGRGPTKQKSKTPIRLNEIIYQWVLDKGIYIKPMPYKRKPSERWQPKYDSAEERALVSFSNAVARKIHKEGTKLYRDRGRADIYSNEIPDALERITNKITAIFSLEVQSININHAKAE